MPPTRGQSRRVQRSASRDQQPRPKQVQHQSHRIDQKPGAAPFNRLTQVAKRLYRLLHDQQRGDDDHDPFKNRRKILCLVVAKRMAGICRPFRVVHRHPGHHRTTDIDQRLQRIRQERNGPRQPPGHQLQAQDQHSHQDRAQSQSFCVHPLHLVFSIPWLRHTCPAGLRHQPASKQI